MNFTSLAFFIFLPVVLLLYWLTPQRFRWITILISSYVFYCFTNIWLIFLISTTTLISYLSAILMEKVKKKKLVLILSLVIILSLLFVFKYLDFTISTIGKIFSLFSLNLSINQLNIILPVGISFYTFQTIAYIVDVYKGKMAAEKHIGYYASFVCYFPQLVAGPIEKACDLLPQLKEKHTINFADFAKGLRFVLSGFIKKILIADFLTLYVNSIYGNLASTSGFEILLATFLFGIVIYCDFSGYSEIALGVSKWMGIDLSINFNRPYLSKSIKEFWNRWHITLNNFFTEYIYIPLSGSKKGKFRKYINIFIVFLLSGLWHGASIHFVLWGILLAFLMIIEDLISPLIEKIKINQNVKNVISIIVTYILINLSWIFFRAQSVAEIGTIFTKIFTDFAYISDSFFNNGFNIALLLICLVILPMIYYLPEVTKDNKNNYQVIAIYFVLIVIVSMAYINNLNLVGESSFIYFEF